MSKKHLYTVAEIVEKSDFSDPQIRRYLRGVKPTGYLWGYQGRKVAAWTKEQVAASIPKKARA
jgi:hypothetical protein